MSLWLARWGYLVATRPADPMHEVYYNQLSRSTEVAVEDVRTHRTLRYGAKDPMLRFIRYGLIEAIGGRPAQRGQEVSMFKITFEQPNEREPFKIEAKTRFVILAGQRYECRFPFHELFD